MKKSLNLDLLEFHVREAAQELDLLLDVVRYAKDDTADDGEIVDCNICLLSKVSISKPLRLCVLCGRLKSEQSVKI